MDANKVRIRQALEVDKLLSQPGLIQKLVDNDFGAYADFESELAKVAPSRPGRLIDAWRAS